MQTCNCALARKIDLDTLQMLAAVGNPQAQLEGRCVHVGGTNGKGSVCAMVYAGLRESGITAGLFTSPHLIAPVDCVRLARSGTELAVDAHRWVRLKSLLPLFIRFLKTCSRCLTAGPTSGRSSGGCNSSTA